MKSTKKDTEQKKTLKGKDAIGEDSKAFKEVFLEETTRVRMKLGLVEQSIKDLQIAVSKIKARLGI